MDYANCLTSFEKSGRRKLSSSGTITERGLVVRTHTERFVGFRRAFAPKIPIPNGAVEDLRLFDLILVQLHCPFHSRLHLVLVAVEPPLQKAPAYNFLQLLEPASLKQFLCVCGSKGASDRI